MYLLLLLITYYLFIYYFNIYPDNITIRNPTGPMNTLKSTACTQIHS